MSVLATFMLRNNGRDDMSQKRKTKPSPFLKAALAYAERGWRVFRLPPKAKKPPPKGWQDLATTDMRQIKKWWTETPRPNIGIATGERSGIIVIDVDGPEGERALLEYGEIPTTFRVNTGKGFHLYFKWPTTKLGNSVGKLGPKLDTTGNGGYVVAPPSNHPEGSRYKCISDPAQDLADLPEPILTALQRESNKPNQLPDEIQKGTRDITLFKAASGMRAKGFSDDAVFAALSIENAQRCKPPCDDSHLLRIIQSIQRYDPGTLAATPRYRFYTDEELLTLPDPEWLIEGVLPAGGLSVLYGKPGVGKSFLALDWALLVATGIGWCGHEVRQGPVLYVVAEGGTHFKLRVQSWRSFHRCEESTSARFMLAPVDLMDQENVRDLIDQILAEFDTHPSLMVLDTLARSMPSGDENLQKDMNQVVAAVDRIRAKLGCHVLLVHHTRRKDDEFRGSSVLPGAADSMFLLKMKDNGLTLFVTKMKDAEQLADTHLRLMSEDASCVINVDRERATTLEQKIESFIIENEGCCFNEIHRGVGGNQGKLRNALERLAKAGAVVDEGTKKRQKWVTPL